VPFAMRLVVAVFLIAALFAVAAEALKKKHNVPTHKPTSSKPPTIAATSAPVVPTSTHSPVFQKTPDQYTYYSSLYMDRYEFLAKNFPHSGPSWEYVFYVVLLAPWAMLAATVLQRRAPAHR